MLIKNQVLWIATIASLFLDRLTKDLVIQNFELGHSIHLWPGVFHLTYVVNDGAAFSMFRGQGQGWLRWLSLLVSLGLMALAIFGPTFDRWEQAGYGLILAGAFGNGVDRFATGSVVDFLHFRLINFPVFNVADVSINLGIGCLLMAALVYRAKPKVRE